MICVRIHEQENMEPWMRVSLLPPPVQTTKMNQGIDVPGLKHACENIIKVLTKQSPLHREGALLSRFVYKYDKKFRNDIGYRNLKKTHSTLRRYMEINLLKDVENFMAVLPGDDDNFLPTKQMLEYILCRIISFSKLLVRTYVCSKQGAVFYLDRVKRGQNHWMSLMPYALLSRVWSMCGVLIHHATSWYSCLHPYLTSLQSRGLQFLSQEYKLPLNLYEWLNLKNLDTFGKLDWAKKKSVMIELALDEEIDSFDNIFKYANNINDDNTDVEVQNDLFAYPIKVAEPRDQFQISHISKIDHGQVISRDIFKALGCIQQDDLSPFQANTEVVPRKSALESCKILTNFQKKLNSDKSSHYFGKVTNETSLKDFLAKEEAFRNDGNTQSLTRHLSFMQWHTLKTTLLKVCDTVLNNRKIERKLSKVWKKKCLDYM